LQQRLVSPAPVSNGRLHHLRLQLELAGIRSWVNTWLAEQLANARQRVQGLLQTTDIPNWLWTIPHLKIITAILSLRDRFRQLGLRLVRQRIGTTPWDIQQEPANLQFIAMLRQRGIDPQPWLEPPADEWIESNNGKRYRVGIERDRFEILRMGEPFNTCLATNGANFFAAVANAVDINKHVIYVRDPQGQIVGRCLLALTEWGQLLTFHVYSNVPEFDLTAWVSRFVIQLASRMNTYCVRDAKVPCLVAHQWYDDGAIEMNSKLAFLAHNSPFRIQLANIPLDEVVQAIEVGCQPLPLNDVVLHAVMTLPELDHRPELITPLLPLINPMTRWPEVVRWRIATLVLRAKPADTTMAALSATDLGQLVKQLRFHGICRCCTKPLLELLLETNPSLLIRAIRQSRDSTVRCDEDEHQRSRRELLSQAYARLARPKLAERLRDRSDHKQTTV
jgi:hypothetical protein